MTSLFVLGVVLLVATFDIVVGVRLLTSERPFSINGAGTLWATATPPVWDGPGRALLTSLFRRLGAFSLHTGVATAVWAVLARDQPVVLAVLLGTYTITGLAFFHNDRTYFRGTRYFVIKQGLGALWALALVGQLVTIATQP